MCKFLLFFGMLFSGYKTLTVVDYKTNETLTGVKVYNKIETYYSDFDGNVRVKGNLEGIEIQYPSYELFQINNDTIYLKNN